MQFRRAKLHLAHEPPATGLRRLQLPAEHHRHDAAGPCRRRDSAASAFGIIGTFLDDWEYNLVFEGGGSGGATSAVLDKGYLTYSGFKPFKIWGDILSVPYTLDRATSNNNITFMERAAPVEVAAGIGASTRSGFGITANERGNGGPAPF